MDQSQAFELAQRAVKITQDIDALGECKEVHTAVDLLVEMLHEDVHKDLWIPGTILAEVHTLGHVMNRLKKSSNLGDFYIYKLRALQHEAECIIRMFSGLPPQHD